MKRPIIETLLIEANECADAGSLSLVTARNMIQAAYRLGQRDARSDDAGLVGDEKLANGLICSLSGEILYKADLFDYLCWLEQRHVEENKELAGTDFLVLASDGTTCWGKSYPDAVKVAMQHDKEVYDAALQSDRKELTP